MIRKFGLLFLANHPDPHFPICRRDVTRGSVLQQPDSEFFDTTRKPVEKFLIKWLHASYLHVSWETEKDLLELVGSIAKVCVYACVCVYMPVCVCVCVCVYICVYVSMYVYVRACVYVCLGWGW